jgi:hypothetical protein
LELLLELFLHFGTSLGVRHLLLGDNILELQIILDDESGWEHMVVVDELDEGLHSALSIELLVAHALGDLSWIAFNTNNEGVSELSVLNENLIKWRLACLPSFHRRFV